MRGQAKIQAKLVALRTALSNAGIVYESRTSNRGVPHVVVKDETARTLASICYFFRADVFRCFHPWPSYGEEQTRFTSPDPEAVSMYVLAVL